MHEVATVFFLKTVYSAAEELSSKTSNRIFFDRKTSMSTLDGFKLALYGGYQFPGIVIWSRV